MGFPEIKEPGCQETTSRNRTVSKVEANHKSVKRQMIREIWGQSQYIRSQKETRKIEWRGKCHTSRNLPFVFWKTNLTECKLKMSEGYGCSRRWKEEVKEGYISESSEIAEVRKRAAAGALRSQKGQRYLFAFHTAMLPPSTGLFAKSLLCVSLL